MQSFLWFKVDLQLSEFLSEDYIPITGPLHSLILFFGLLTTCKL